MPHWFRNDFMRNASVFLDHLKNVWEKIQSGHIFASEFFTWLLLLLLQLPLLLLLPFAAAAAAKFGMSNLALSKCNRSQLNQWANCELSSDGGACRGAGGGGKWAAEVALPLMMLLMMMMLTISRQISAALFFFFWLPNCIWFIKIS